MISKRRGIHSLPLIDVYKRQDAKSFVTVIDVPSVSLFDGQLVIKGITIVTILSCIVIMAGLMLFVQKTKPGRAMQAVSEDRDAAQLMGVNVNATISMTFAIGSGLAAIAGQMCIRDRY